MPGRLPYSLGGVGALAAAGTAHYSMYSGSQTIYQGQALNITIANGARFGGGMRISPGSLADDGILDQVVIGDIGKWRALVALSRLYAGTHIGMPGISVTPATGPIRIVRTDGNLLIEADGEEFAAGPELEIEVLPGALLLVN
jgi:diacylglycerol kinase (ATP)